MIFQFELMIKEFASSSGDMVIKVDYDKCTGAAKCVEVCPVDIY
ncbi:MAG: hypothetical protein DRN37_00210, partial [Thermoplasmata archaeon]